MSNWLCIIGEPKAQINDVLPYKGKLYFCGDFSSETFIGCLADNNLKWFGLTSNDFSFNRLCSYRDHLAVSGVFLLGFLNPERGDFEKCWTIFDHNEEYHIVNDIYCTNDFAVACNENGCILRASISDLSEVMIWVKSPSENIPTSLLSIYHFKEYAVTGRQAMNNNSLLILLEKNFNVGWCIDFSETKEGMWLSEPYAVCLERDRIYVSGNYCYTLCFNLDGELLWGHILPSEFTESFPYSTPSIAVDEERLYFTYGGYFLVLDKYTGKLVRGFKVYIKGVKAEISKVKIINNNILMCGSSDLGGFIAFFPKENVDKIKSSDQYLQVVEVTPKVTNIHPQIKHLDLITEEYLIVEEFTETLLDLEKKPVKITSYSDAPIL